MKKKLLLILLTFFTVLATPYPVSSSSENYKISLIEETVTILDDLSVHVQLNYAFIPLIEEGYYYDTWTINIHTGDADRITVENEYGPLQFEQVVDGNWTLLTIDLGRKVYANENYLLNISYFADDRISVLGSEKSLRMWTGTGGAYKENVTLTVNIPQNYGVVEYEPSFLSTEHSANGTKLSGQMIGVSAEESYYLNVKFADTVVYYNVTNTYTFTNEGSSTEDVFDYEVLGPLDTGLQEIMQINSVPTPVSISYDESGNPRYKFTIESIASGEQTTLTINFLIKIRLSPDYNESYIVELDEIPLNLLQYTTADVYWEVDNPTIKSLSMNLTEGETGVLNKVKSIYDFVIDNIEYDYDKLEKIVNGENTERYGAIDTYTLGRGVCEDYADLFVTLCRASGIPANVVEGYIYHGDGLQDYGHAWADVYIPEYGWLQVDPTWELFGILEGRHISELVNSNSSDVMQTQWWAREPFSYDMTYNISLLETASIFIPDVSVSASYEDETSFNNDVNIRLIIQNKGNGTAYSTNVTVSVSDGLMLLNESTHSLGKLDVSELIDLNFFMRAYSVGNASVEVSIAYQTNDGVIEVQHYLYNISIMKAITNISCRVLPSKKILANNISIQGFIIPSGPDKNVILTIIKPDGEAVTRSVITESNGSFYFSFAPYVIGSWEVNASWEGDGEFEGSTSPVVHFTVQKIPVSISFQTSDSQITEGDSVTVSGSLNPAVSGADVFLAFMKPDGSTSTRTVSINSDGSFSEVYISPETGSWSVMASWLGDSTYSASISETVFFTVVEPASFELNDLVIEPSSVKESGSITISIECRNVGGVSGSYDVLLMIDGETEDTSSVTVDAGESSTISFDVSATQEGTYSVEIGDLTGSYTVNPQEPDPKSGGIPGFPIISVIVGVIAGVIVLSLQRSVMNS